MKYYQLYTYVKSDFILQIQLLLTRFYRYDVHDTILLKHTFWFNIGDAMKVIKKMYCICL